jgi:hypothetical protein
MYSLRHSVAMAGLAVIVGIVFPQPKGYAQDKPSQTPGEARITPAASEEDLLKSAQNPVADLISVPIQDMTDLHRSRHLPVRGRLGSPATAALC